MVFSPVKLSNLPITSPEVRRHKLRLQEGAAGRGLLGDHNNNKHGDSILKKFSFPSFSSRSSKSSKSKKESDISRKFGSILGDDDDDYDDPDEQTIDPFFESPSVFGDSVMGFSAQESEEQRWQQDSKLLGGSLLAGRCDDDDDDDYDIDPSTGLFEESERGNQGLDFGTVSVVSSHYEDGTIDRDPYDGAYEASVAESATYDGLTYDGAETYQSGDEIETYEGGASQAISRHSYEERYQQIQNTIPQQTSPLINSPLKSPQKLLALADHGDWSGLDNNLKQDKLRKSTDNKTRQLVSVPYLDDDGSSSSSDEDESTVSIASPLIDILEDDDDDDESIAAGETETRNDRPAVRRNVSRMSSGQLRRWDGFQQKVQELVGQAMPDKVDDVPTLMRQFAGREAELIRTLENIISRSPRRKTNRAAIPRSRAIVGSRIVTFVKMDAIASIAAASTLDDNTLSIRPELVIDDSCTIVKPSSNDSFFDSATTTTRGRNYLSDEDVSSSDDSSSDGSSYSDSDEDSSSYESEDGYSRNTRSVQGSTWNFQ